MIETFFPIKIVDLYGIKNILKNILLWERKQKFTYQTIILLDYRKETIMNQQSNFCFKMGTKKLIYFI